jgi:hypothetical protein
MHLIVANSHNLNERGDFVLVDGEVRTPIGNYLEVVSTGEHDVEILEGWGHNGRTVCAHHFGVRITHSAIHNDDNTLDTTLCVTNNRVWQFLLRHLVKDQAHKLRTVKYQTRQYDWYWPAIDGWMAGTNGLSVRTGLK